MAGRISDFLFYQTSPIWRLSSRRYSYTDSEDLGLLLQSSHSSYFAEKSVSCLFSLKNGVYYLGETSLDDFETRISFCFRSDYPRGKPLGITFDHTPLGKKSNAKRSLCGFAASNNVLPSRGSKKKTYEVVITEK